MSSVDEKYLEAYKSASELLEDVDTTNDTAWVESLSAARDRLKPFQNKQFGEERLAILASTYVVSVQALLEVKTKILQGQGDLDKNELVLAIQMNDAKQEMDKYIAQRNQEYTATDRSV